MAGNVYNIKNISITGDLGSGKSTVAKKLSQKLNLEYFSTGSLQRKLAQERGVDTLELNYISEKDTNIDDYIDQYLKDINVDVEKNYILDSRLAWFFVDKSFKIYLTIVPEIAAKRVLNDHNRQNEPEAHTLEERIYTLLERQRIENRRFKSIYNVDCRDFNNYNLIIDTSYASVDEIVELIVTIYKDYLQGKKHKKMWVSPQILYPTQDIRSLASDNAKLLSMQIKNAGFDENYAVDTISVDGALYIWDGHKRVSASIQNGISFVPTTLLASDSEEIHKGHTAKMFVDSIPPNKFVYDWEDMHNFEFYKHRS
jgi:cytidylate kinase